MAQRINNNQIKEEDWITPTLEDGWTHYGQAYTIPGYWKDSSGVVHLRGMVKGGAIGSGSAIFTLPAGFRPAYQEIHAAISNTAVARCDIRTTGVVVPYTGNNSWYSIDGISFKAEQ